MNILIETIYSAVDGSEKIKLLGSLNQLDLKKIEECVQIRKGYEQKKFSAFKQNIITINNPFKKDIPRRVEGWGESESGSYEFGSIGSLFYFDLYKNKIRFLAEPSIELTCRIKEDFFIPFHIEKYSFHVESPSLDEEEDYFHEVIDFDLEIRRKIISNEDFKRAVVDALKTLYSKMCQQALATVSVFASRRIYQYHIAQDDEELPF